MSKYKIIYKKDGMLIHEHIESKTIDEVSAYVRRKAGKEALLVYARKEREA
jgi:hypothetical protein